MSDVSVTRELMLCLSDEDGNRLAWLSRTEPSWVDPDRVDKAVDVFATSSSSPPSPAPSAPSAPSWRQPATATNRHPSTS